MLIDRSSFLEQNEAGTNTDDCIVLDDEDELYESDITMITQTATGQSANEEYEETMARPPAPVIYSDDYIVIIEIIREDDQTMSWIFEPARGYYNCILCMLQDAEDLFWIAHANNTSIALGTTSENPILLEEDDEDAQANATCMADGTTSENPIVLDGDDGDEHATATSMADGTTSDNCIVVD
jgi:hypothetical protein